LATAAIVAWHAVQGMCPAFVPPGLRSITSTTHQLSGAGVVVGLIAGAEVAAAAIESTEGLEVVAGDGTDFRSIALKLFYCAIGIALFINNFGDQLFPKTGVAAAIAGSEELMSEKAHGTAAAPVQKVLRWECDSNTADRICCFNRHAAERSGYYSSVADFCSAVDASKRDGTEMTFYDSVTGKALFVAPRGRTWDDFLNESQIHGWPSFRDDEVITDDVRVLPNGETVSVDGTHLGHNLPDSNGNRYCINLVSVAGKPVS